MSKVTFSPGCPAVTEIVTVKAATEGSVKIELTLPEAAYLKALLGATAGVALIDVFRELADFARRGHFPSFLARDFLDQIDDRRLAAQVTATFGGLRKGPVHG